MEAYIEALLEEEPRFASEYLAMLIVALTHEFIVDEPGRYDKAYFLDIYIGPQNKRHVVIYVGLGRSRDEITKITRVDYTLPVPAEGAPLFGGHAGEVMPSDGPLFRYITEMDVEEFMNVDRVIAEDVAASAAKGPTEEIKPWISEIRRLERAQAADKAELARLGAPAVESAEVKRLRKRLNLIHNALYFWNEMHPKVLEHIERAGILMPGAISPRSPVRPLRRYQARRRTSNVHALTSSRSSERARRTARRRAPRNAIRGATRRHEIDPVTGKRVPRRRWRFSDPRDSVRLEETNRPSPMIRGGRAGYEGNSNVSAPASSPGPRRNNSRGPSPPDLF